MSSKGKTTNKVAVTKTKKQSSKRREKITCGQIGPSKSGAQSSSVSDSSVSHQQHHSAPPSQSQQSKAGLQSINENVEYLPTNRANEQQQSQRQYIVNSHFPRSNTVPYPAYATFRKGGGNNLASQHYYTDYPSFLYGTISSPQAYLYYSTREPLSSINTNFQPISPHHHQNSSRPVDVLKPTFLIVPKEAEQQLTAQLSTSTSSVPIASSTTKLSSKTMPKKTDAKIQQQKTTTNESTSPKVRSVEVQTNDHSPTRTTTEGVTIMDNTHQHVGLIATPNPSPYVHFVNVSYPTQSPQLLQDGPPETSIINDESIQVNDYHQQTGSIRSMPNIAMTQGKN